MDSKDRIKNILLFLLLAGHELDRTNLVYTLSELADLSSLSGEGDFDENTLCKEFSSTVRFVEDSVLFFFRAKNNLEEMDNWLEYYKNELIKAEEFNLIIYLSL